MSTLLEPTMVTWMSCCMMFFLLCPNPGGRWVPVYCVAAAKGRLLACVLGDVLFINGVHGNLDVGFYFFALDGLGQDLHRLLAQLGWVLRDGGDQGAVFNSLEAVFGAVEADNLHVLAGLCTQCLDGTQRHFIIHGQHAGCI